MITGNMQRLAQWLYTLSAVLHMVSYPVSTVGIILGFWRFGFLRGLLCCLWVTLVMVILNAAFLAFVSTFILLLDPNFFV